MKKEEFEFVVQIISIILIQISIIIIANGGSQDLFFGWIIGASITLITIAAMYRYQYVKKDRK